MERSSSQRNMMIVAAFAIMFIAMTFWRVRDYSDKSADLQTLVKLAAIIASVAVPLAAIVAGRFKPTHPLTLIWLAFLTSFVVSSTHAPIFTVSFIDSVAFVGCLLLSLWMVDNFGEDLVIALLIATVGIISAISLVVYFVDPQLGRMFAWLGSEFGANNRIRGIAGSSNGLGSMTSMTLVMCVLYFHRMKPQARAIVFAAAPLALVCLAMSDNRMSMIMLVICATVWNLRKGNMTVNVALIVLAGVVMALLFLSAPDALLSDMSRSGNAEEITSGTGRATIWAVVLELIEKKPIFGYGYAAATSILPNDPRLFSVAAHTHNLYLEVLFSGGAVSFLLFLTGIIATIFYAIRYACIEPLIILVFFLFRGLTEPTPFGSMPSFTGYAFFIGISFIVRRAEVGKQAKRLADVSRARAGIARCRQYLRASPMPPRRPA